MGVFHILCGFHIHCQLHQECKKTTKNGCLIYSDPEDSDCE